MILIKNSVMIIMILLMISIMLMIKRMALLMMIMVMLLRMMKLIGVSDDNDIKDVFIMLLLIVTLHVIMSLLIR